MPQDVDVMWRHDAHAARAARKGHARCATRSHDLPLTTATASQTRVPAPLAPADVMYSNVVELYDTARSCEKSTGPKMEKPILLSCGTI